MEITGFEENIELYPCSCGHCTSCGVNFIATPEEERRWAEQEAEEEMRWEKVDGEWFKVW